MPQRVAGLKEALHSAGRRVTGQRKLLLDLIQAQEGHVDAQELFELARARDPRISLATVYRTMGLLCELGLVDELHLGEKHHHYELRPRSTHCHLVCLGCGAVVEFSSPMVGALERAVARAHGFAISGAQIELSGYCPRCRAARAG